MKQYPASYAGFPQRKQNTFFSKTGGSPQPLGGGRFQGPLLGSKKIGLRAEKKSQNGWPKPHLRSWPTKPLQGTLDVEGGSGHCESCFLRWFLVSNMMCLKPCASSQHPLPHWTVG